MVATNARWHAYLGLEASSFDVTFLSFSASVRRIIRKACSLHDQGVSISHSICYSCL